MPVQPLAQSQKHSRCLSKRPWRGRGGESEGEGTSCVQLLFALERGDEAPHHHHGRSLPSPVPSSSSTSHTMGQLPKLAVLDCPMLVPPPQPSSVLTRGVGQPGRGRNLVFNRRFVSSQQLLLFFFPLSLLSSTQPQRKRQPPPSFDKMPGGTGWRGGEGAAEKMHAVCHVPVSKEQIHLYRSF